ncbi:MAG: nodulation protein NfeD [Calditrichaeota bacterium]|nr:MAG: nodulation protein NfeD [Calditrichota bacterium]
MRSLGITGALLSLGFLLTVSAQERVNLITIDGPINPAIKEFISNAIEQSEEEEALCLIIQLDTPGGLVETTQEITKAFFASRIPIVVYVAPPGAWAASAGTFITLAAHVAAMAPGTNIGAASVVSLGMGADSANATMLRKATNNAVASIKSIAEERGRNVEWAEKAVTEAASITASEALKLNVIDFVAPTLDSLLILMDGKVVKTTLGTDTLKTAQATIHTIDMPLRVKILDLLSNPNIAYILFIIGIWGLFFEFYNPGVILPGVIGGICLILAFYAMNTLPVNYAGILLILLSIIMFLLEIKIPSYGILTIGGFISFILGSIMLYDSDLPFMKLSWEIILTVAIFTALFFIFAVGMGLRAQRLKPAIGREHIVQDVGQALENFRNGTGQILYEGEIWQAVSDDKIRKDDRVKVIKVEGLTLTVKKLSDEE